MAEMSRRKFLQLSMLAGSGLIASDWIATTGRSHWSGQVLAAEPIKIGIIDPLSSPYKTSSIHDVHGATVAMESFNKRGGVLGRPVTLIEADDASNVETAVKAAQKLIGQDRVDVLMGTFNGDVALAVSELAMRENKLFMVTGAHIMELTGARCNARTFVFMPNARMMAQAVTPALAKAYGKRWYMITADTVDGRSALQAMTTALAQQGGEVVGSATTPFGATDFSSALMQARQAKPDAVILNLYGWDLVNALKSYAKLELAKEKIGVGGMIGGEQIGRPLGYANNAGIWGLIWDPKVNTESSRRFIQGVIDKYQHTPTSRCYLGYAAMIQILEAIERAGTTDTSALIKALEGHEFDGLKEGKSYFRTADHQHVQDVLVGEAYGKELGLGHYKIIATVRGETTAPSAGEQACRLAG
ncbi:MAG TPA: ABC transporter substrate-binding protein [Nitrospiraceae bacterium]|nr:ABC transporter substrate-binding protein [Nitrospiraceae bacterium]